MHVKYIQYNAGSAGTMAEGSCEIGDSVLFSYQAVSDAYGLIRSVAFVWSRTESWLGYSAPKATEYADK